MGLGQRGRSRLTGWSGRAGSSPSSCVNSKSQSLEIKSTENLSSSPQEQPFCSVWRELGNSGWSGVRGKVNFDFKVCGQLWRACLYQHTCISHPKENAPGLCVSPSQPPSAHPRLIMGLRECSGTFCLLPSHWVSVTAAQTVTKQPLFSGPSDLAQGPLLSSCRQF